MHAKESGSQPEATAKSSKTPENLATQEPQGSAQSYGLRSSAQPGANSFPQGHSPRRGLPHPSRSSHSNNHLLELQRLYGNRSVQRMLGHAGPSASLPNSTHDRLHQPALSEVRQATAGIAHNPEVRRTVAGTESGPSMGPPTAETNESVPGHEEAQAATGDDAASPRLGAATPVDHAHALPLLLRSRMQAAFGHGFEHVRIRTDNSAASAAAKHGAHAITVGSEISFGSGEFAPYTGSGDRLLAHELTHVVQHDQGRMPSHGVLSPGHELEREAYATERRVVARLPSIDDRIGVRNESSTAPAKYRGEPTIARFPDEPPAAGGARRGPSTTETALMGPLPSAEEARAQVFVPSEPTPDAPLPAQRDASPAAPAPTREEQQSPGSNTAPTRTEPDQAAGEVLPPIEANAGGAAASPPAAVHKPAPRFRQPSEWTLTLTRENSLRIEALRAAAATNVERIRSRAENSVADARSAFASARTRFDAEAQTALAAIDASHGEGAQRIDREMAAQEAELDAHFATSADEARGTTDDARNRLTEVVEAEANRSIAESDTRATRASGLAESSNVQGDPPLAEGQRDIASRVASEIAAQCQQTGQDAAAEVRKAGASHGAGIDTYVNQVLETLDSARVAALAKLARSRDETLAALTEQASGASHEVEARKSEAMSALDQQEETQSAWIREHSERECSELSMRAEEDIEVLTANFQSLSESFADVAAQAEPFFTAGSADNPQPGPCRTL